MSGKVRLDHLKQVNVSCTFLVCCFMRFCFLQHFRIVVTLIFQWLLELCAKLWAASASVLRLITWTEHDELPDCLHWLRRSRQRHRCLNCGFCRLHPWEHQGRLRRCHVLVRSARMLSVTACFLLELEDAVTDLQEFNLSLSWHTPLRVRFAVQCSWFSPSAPCWTSVPKRVLVDNNPPGWETGFAISTWRSLHSGWTCVCCTTELRELVVGRLAVLFRCLLLAMLFFACCWPCSSLPAVGHALLCLLLAMLFLRRLFGSACACHPRLLPVVTQRPCCSSPSSVSLGGPPDCNANSLFQLCHWLFSSPCACHSRLFSAYPNSILWVASSKWQSSFAIVLCSTIWHCLFLSSFPSLALLAVILSPFFLLLTSPPASGVFLGRHFVVVYDNVIVNLVPPTPLLGLRHFVIVGSR